VSEKEWIVGIHTVTELLKQHPQEILELLIQQDRDDERIKEIKTLATELGITWKALEKRDLEKRITPSGKGNAQGRPKPPVHQGVAASCPIGTGVKDERFLYAMLEKLQHPALLLVLDEITDPHNLGACLRTADAAGIDAVILPKDKSAPLNMTVRKVASGAAETVNIIAVTNLSRTLAELKQRGIWITGAAGEAEQSLYDIDFTPPTAIVMGSEGKGLRRLTREHCDYLLSIPMAGKLSSLNVSVATGICLYEAVRQRKAQTSSPHA